MLYNAFATAVGTQYFKLITVKKMPIMLEPNAEVVEAIVGKLKTNGMFDEMRRSCLADIDTKPAFQNLKQRVENYVNALLSAETWTPSLNKNQLRTKVRTSVMRSGMLNSGVEHILHQVVDAKMYTEFLPKITEYIEENRGQLYKELAPESEPPAQDLAAETDSQVEDNQDMSLADTESEKLDPAEDETKNKDEKDVPNIPEGAASTLRTLIQSLMTSNIQSLLTIGGEEEGGEKKGKAEQDKSPVIDPAHIESFTDEESERDPKQSADGGPHTPVLDERTSPASQSLSGSSPEQPEAEKDSDDARRSDSSSAYDEQEDLGKVHSDASFESSGEHGLKSDCEVAVEEEDNDDGDEEEKIVEESYTYEEGEVNVINVNDAFETSVEDIEVLEMSKSESVVVEDCVVEDVNEITMAVQSNEENIEITHHIHREKKKRHKKHKRRRHSSVDDSDESPRVATPSDRDSSDDGRVGGAEVLKSKSRKKKKKKRSKKTKRLKSKARESSQERLQWDSSSEYRRSSMSPSHPDMGQRHFITSPMGGPPIRFEEGARSVKVEPAFRQMTPRFRDPYAVDRGMEEPRPPQASGEHKFPLGHPDEGMVGFPRHPGFPPRSPPHYGQHMPPRFSPPRFRGHSRFSPPYSRMPYPMRPGSPPPRPYSPTYEYYHRPHFDGPGPSRSPPPQRRFSPPRQIVRFPGGPRPFPGPSDERFMLRPGMPGPRGMPPGPMMRPEGPPGPPMDMRRPPMR